MNDQSKPESSSSDGRDTLPEGIEHAILLIDEPPDWLRKFAHLCVLEGAAQERALVDVESFRLAADLLAAEVKSSRQNVGNFLKDLADNVLVKSKALKAARTPPPPDKCRACNGTGGGENRMGGPEWTCDVCKGTGSTPPPPEAQK